MSQDLRGWLSALGLSDYAQAFLENKIDFAILPELTGDDLIEIGVTAVGDRRRLLRAIAELDKVEEIAAFEPETPMEPARRQVTVMFADLTGFTKLSSELDAEDMHALLNDFFSKVDSIVEKYGGRIDKHIGDAVMAVFGAPISHTNDTERAARAGLDIHEALQTLTPPLSCHIGIASGQVIASTTGSQAHTEYTVTGDGVNLASRLTDISTPGETLVSHDIQRALGPLFVGDSIGTKAIKGLNDPVEVWRLDRLARNIRTRRHRFIGREREMSLFSATFDRCQRHGKGEVHIVLGEPGIGKTHLSEQVAELAASLSYSIHNGVVMDFGAREGHSAIQSVARSILGLEATDDTATAAAVAKDAIGKGWVGPPNAAHLSALLELEQDPGLAEVYAVMDNKARLRGRRQVIDELLSARSKDAPLLIQVEDIHWASPDILTACSHIAAATRDLPCVLMMTSRVEGDPINRDWQMGTDGALVSKLELAPMGEEQSRKMVEEFTAIDPGLLDTCVKRAGGNPLFLEQLLRNIDVLKREGVPGSIQGIVQSRLDSLDRSSRTAIQAASVLGQRFSPEILNFILGEGHLDTTNLIRSALIREADADLMFAHALIRDGSYATLVKSERARLHRQAAKSYEDRDATLRAQHLDRAGASNAAQAYLEAADKLIQAFQFSDASPLIERALELPSPAGVRFDLLCARGETHRLQGFSDDALREFKEAAELAETDEQVSRAHIGLAQAARQASLYQEALAALDIAEAAAERCGSDRDVAQINYVRGNVYFPLGRDKEALQANERALSLARKLESARLEVGALSGFGDANFMKATMQTATGFYTQAVERAREKGLVRDLAANLHNLSVARSYTGDVWQGMADANEAIEVSQKYFAFVPECVAQTCLGVAQTFLGELDQALDAFTMSSEIAKRVGAKRLEAQALEHLARTQVYVGQLAEARETGRRAVEIALEHGRTFVGPKALSALAMAETDPDEQDRLLKLGAEIIAAGCVGHSHLHFYPDASAVMLARGDWDAALRYAEGLAEFTAKEPLPMVDLSIRQVRLLAECGAQNEAPDFHDGFAELRERFDEMGIAQSLLGRVDFLTKQNGT
ncbi:tetratricopeptide repeat protein [Rhodobacteraceae bacterium B1Z28]|uniref:Tetratricopeptide repeat protein n=1 Tax=Ruegeria haliotis TaxID=2747601 RepID=A0ABX2PSP3_9RHOB|nr:adenylate/guanylate cyclase domain-containing protein [Ruegeria haliotis]NVO56759.1 tetratricopeptide repeat protein [Ruegeria haliotis]